MNRRGFLGALAALVVAPATALRTKFTLRKGERLVMRGEWTAGDINRATNRFWQSRVITTAERDVAFDHLKAAMRRVWE